MNLKSPYRLRAFKVDNLAEIERINLMYYHPSVMEAKGYDEPGVSYINEADLQEKDSSLVKVFSTITPTITDISYAVVDQLDRLVGWIWFYTDKSHPLPRRIVNRLGLNSDNCRIYQLSYEKLMSDGWPQELVAKIVHSDLRELYTPKKGVIVEGLSMALKRLTSQFHEIYPTPHRLVIYGYISPDNIASKIVLERNGFEKEVRQYSYGQALHDLWVKVI